MTVQALLSDLQALGVTLETHGDRLRFHPRDAVCPDLLARLRDQKAELLAILATPTAPVATDPDLTTALAGLTPDDLAHYHVRLSARRDAGESVPGIEWRALVDVRVDRGHWPAAPAPVSVPRRRIVGCGFPPWLSPPPDPRIIAAPVPICPRCWSDRVLPELRTMTGGICWDCWVVVVSLLDC